MQGLSDAAGHTANLHVDWKAVWTALELDFPDKASFVPSMSGAAVAILEALTDAVGDRTWKENLWTQLDAKGKKEIDVYFVVSHHPSTNP